jgi:hypothetical protein
MEKLQNYIDNYLSTILSKLTNQNVEYTLIEWRLAKSKLSGKKIAEALGINEAMLVEFETVLDLYDRNRDNDKVSYTSSLRVCLWLETISKKIEIKFLPDFNNSQSNEDSAIKQVRALELIIRSLINEQIGGSDSVKTTLQSLFKQEIIEKWLKSSDETGILSGTTFSELSNILLDKNIFNSIEDIFNQIEIKLSKNLRESLRFILEDIRIIRNSIAHNKRISEIQIESLNNYYLIITQFIDKSDKSKIDIKSYFDLASANILNYLGTLKEDNLKISGSLDEINSKTDKILENTKSINKKNSLIIGLVILVIVISGVILYFQKSTSESTKNIETTTNKIDKNVEKVFDRFDQLESALKSANPIANPKTANDFIINAYIFKNAGETNKAISMFESYFKLTDNIKFDLYLDYYEALKTQFSTDVAQSKLNTLKPKDMANAVICMTELFGNKSMNKIKKSNLTEEFKNYLVLTKATEISSEYSGPKLYSFYIDMINKRMSLGGDFEKIGSLFFNRTRAGEILKNYSWDKLKGEIILTSTQGKQYGKDDKDFWSKIEQFGENMGYSKKNIADHKKLSTDASFIEEFKKMQ